MRIKTKDLALIAETFFAFLIMEIILRGFTMGFDNNGHLGEQLWIILLFTAAFGAGLFLIKTLIPGLAGRIAYDALMIFFSLIYISQLVYYSIFETYYTIYSMINGAQVAEFQDVIWGNLWAQKIPALLTILVGIAMVIIMHKQEKRFERRGTPREERKTYGERLILSLIALLIILATAVGAYLISSVESDDPESPYQKLYSIGEIQGTVQNAGLMGAMGIDTWRLIFGFEPKLVVEEEYVEPEPEDNIIESLNFSALAAAEEDETIKAMHKYFGSLKPTKQNDKTGIFAGKNLIFITAESFTDFAIDPVYTPTLYKLFTEGYNFTNFYNPIWGVSTLDGEYVNLLSLVPEPGVWSLKESANNDLPFTLGHQFMNLNFKTTAYHNHSIYYYNRDKSHPNLGYDFKGQGREYSFKNTWPESDYEMVDKTTADFLTAGNDGQVQPFHVYYLTVSGHLNYNFYGNQMAYNHQEEVKDLDMSDACKAYIATHIELDNALELLLQRLDEAGQLENTVIALAGDHYPYGLHSDYISEFKGHTIDETYELYESAFILWTPGMEPETVNKVCCNMDILPTLSNMFGLDYDSRLFMGKDIFSDSEGLVVFKDKNWISSEGKRDELVGKDDEYVADMDKKVTDMFNYSALVLNKNYYSYLVPYLSSTAGITGTS